MSTWGFSQSRDKPPRHRAAKKKIHFLATAAGPGFANSSQDPSQAAQAALWSALGTPAPPPSPAGVAASTRAPSQALRAPEVSDHVTRRPPSCWIFFTDLPREGPRHLRSRGPRRLLFPPVSAGRRPTWVLGLVPHSEVQRTGRRLPQQRGAQASRQPGAHDQHPRHGPLSPRRGGQPAVGGTAKAQRVRDVGSALRAPPGPWAVPRLACRGRRGGDRGWGDDKRWRPANLGFPLGLRASAWLPRQAGPIR